MERKINACTQNIDKINWESFLVMNHQLLRNTLSVSYINKSDCFNFKNIKTDIIRYKKGNIDTITMTLKEVVLANKKLTIDIQEFDADSIKILQSVINQKSLNL